MFHLLTECPKNKQDINVCKFILHECTDFVNNYKYKVYRYKTRY